MPFLLNYFRLKFLGKVLTVERIGSNTKNTNSQNNSEVRRDSSGPTSLLKDSSDTRNSVYGGEPIAPRLGVDYPFPPHLEYVLCIHDEVFMLTSFSLRSIHYNCYTMICIRRSYELTW